MARAIVAILCLALVIIIAIQGGQAALDDAGPQTDITSESFTPDPGNVTTLDHSNLENTDYDDSVTVKDNNGDVVDPNVDYLWHQNNGTIETVTGGELDGAPSATIDYGYEKSTDQQMQLASLIGMIWNALALILPFLAVIILLALIKQ